MNISGLVSVITPVYNAERFIIETVKSVLAQSYQNWEHILIIDENSRDGSEKLLRDLARQDSRIKIVRDPRAKGAAQNRNIGLAHAKGEFVAFLDADDLWDPRKLDLQIRFMAEKGSTFSFTDYTRISEDGTKTGKTIRVPESLTYNEILFDNPVGCLTVVVKRERLKANPFQELGWEDLALWLDLLRDGEVGHGLRTSLAWYRIVKGSRSNNKLFSAKLRWKTFRDFEKLPLSKSVFFMFYYSVAGAIKHWRL